MDYASTRSHGLSRSDLGWMGFKNLREKAMKKVDEVVKKILTDLEQSILTSLDQSANGILFLDLRELLKMFEQCEDAGKLLSVNGNILQSLDDLFTSIDLFEQFGFVASIYQQVSSDRLMIRAESQEG